MDAAALTTALITLVASFVGGALAIFGDRFRDRRAARAAQSQAMHRAVAEVLVSIDGLQSRLGYALETIEAESSTPVALQRLLRVTVASDPQRITEPVLLAYQQLQRCAVEARLDQPQEIVDLIESVLLAGADLMHALGRPQRQGLLGKLTRGPKFGDPKVVGTLMQKLVTEQGELQRVTRQRLGR